jgi:DegV family protein with EDD domain
MKQVAIVTDSIGCLNREQAEHYGISIVPIKILFDGRVYSDGVDLSTSEAYRLLEKDPDSFSTAPSSPSDYIDIFRNAGTGGHDVLCITVSSHLSTTYNVARLAGEQVESEIPGMKIEVMDSKTATSAQGFIAMGAAIEAAGGRVLADVIKAAASIKDKVQALFLLDTIQHAYRTGRVPKIVSQMGSMLNIKPVITISDGVVRFLSAVRSRSRGCYHIIEIMKRKAGDRPIHAAVMHTDIPEEARILKERIAGEFNCIELFIAEVSPIIGYAIGRGTLALAYY